ncbi:MAG: hypothetical protein JW791_04500 [Nanoarchaeota archaeon]|nr:hypothetical protein [Nanoarchaeota archaeon]
MVVCPKCGKEASYIEQYDRHYCFDCKEYLPIQPKPVAEPKTEESKPEQKETKSEEISLDEIRNIGKKEEKKKPNYLPFIIMGIIIVIGVSGFILFNTIGLSNIFQTSDLITQQIPNPVIENITMLGPVPLYNISYNNSYTQLLEYNISSDDILIQLLRYKFDTCPTSPVSSYCQDFIQAFECNDWWGFINEDYDYEELTSTYSLLLTHNDLGKQVICVDSNIETTKTVCSWFLENTYSCSDFTEVVTETTPTITVGSDFTTFYDNFITISDNYLYYEIQHNSTTTNLYDVNDIDLYYSIIENYLNLNNGDFKSGLEWDSYGCNNNECSLDAENEAMLSKKEGNLLYDGIQSTCSYCSCPILNFNEPDDYGSDSVLSKYEELNYFITNDYVISFTSEDSNINGNICQMFSFEITPPTLYYQYFRDVEIFNSLTYNICLDENGIPIYFRQEYSYEGTFNEYLDVYEAYKIFKTNEEIMNKQFFEQTFDSWTLEDTSECIDW